MKLVCVEWVDSHSCDPWQTIEEARRDAAEALALIMRTVGYLLADETDYVLVAGSWSPGTGSEDRDLVCGTMQIPRFAVKELRVLENDDPDDSGAESERGSGVPHLYGVRSE